MAMRFGTPGAGGTGGPAGASLSPRMPRLSLRLRLTLWIVLIYLIVELSLAFVYEMYQRRSINSIFDARMQQRAGEFARELRARLPGLTSAELARITADVQSTMLINRLVVEVLDAHNNVVASSLATPRPLSLSTFAGVPEAGPATISLPVSFLESPGARSVRAAATWTEAPNGARYVVVAAWDDHIAQSMLALLSTVVLVSVPIGVVAVALSAYLISGIAVRPLRDVREVARRLGPQSLGEPVHMPGAGSEVAELQMELERARSRLEAAFGAQERFMANVSHELKTPIAVLLAEAQVLPASMMSRELKAFIQSASDELEKLGRTVDSFLLLTRIRHGKAALNRSDVCLARDVLMDSYEGCAPMAAQYGVKIAMRLPEGDGAEAGVAGNCDLLRTVVDNLIRNAIRFTPKGQAVDVGADVRGDRLLVTVRDRGPGIPPALLPHIFDRFSQAKEEERRGRGQGLGLEIALGITELHGGTISVANREDGGCQFVVSLPLAREETWPTPGNGMVHGPAGSNGAASHGKRTTAS